MRAALDGLELPYAPNGKSSLSIGRIEIPQRSCLLPSPRYAILSVGSTGGFGLRRREFITLLGGAALAGSPADFGKLIADETEKWGKVVKFSGVKAD